MKLKLLISIFVVGCLSSSSFANGLEDKICNEYYWATKSLKPEYKKAFDCYKTAENHLMLALMLGKGEGAPQDCAKAVKEAELLIQDFPEAEDYKTLKEQLRNCRTTSSENMSIDKYALSTQEMRIMQNYEMEHEQFVQDYAVNEASKKLSLKARQLLKNLRESAYKFNEAEGWWQSVSEEGGSIRPLEAASTELELNKTFTEELIQDMKAPSLASVTQADFKAADAALNLSYKKAIATEEGSGRTDLKSAQKAWISYRDSWADFDYQLAIESKSKLPGESARLARKTALTKARAAQLAK